MTTTQNAIVQVLREEVRLEFEDLQRSVEALLGEQLDDTVFYEDHLEPLVNEGTVTESYEEDYDYETARTFYSI